SLHAADFARGQCEKYCSRSDYVTKSHRHASKKQRKWNRAAWIFDLFSHEGGSFGAAEGEGQHRPEDYVVEVSAGLHRVQRELSGGAVTMPGNQSHYDDDADGDPHSECAHIMQPLADVEADDVQQRGHA